MREDDLKRGQDLHIELAMGGSPFPVGGAARRPFDLDKIRADFPVLETLARGKPLIYLDNAATTLKPRSVVAAVEEHFLLGAANIHRGVHYLSEQATDLFEGARDKVKKFLNAKNRAEIILTSGTTASINLVARCYGATFLKEGDEIVITTMEHHSNIVPWQMLCESKGTKLKVAPINDCGEVIIEEFAKLITPKTKILSFVYISNSLGTINPAAEMIKLARERGPKDLVILVDAAQTVAHKAIDVQSLGCDFLAFSAHKLFGPTGVGVLWGRQELLEKMPPLFGGGDMIRSVTFEKTTYAEAPSKFEAGTPNIGGVIGLGAAIDYVESIGLTAINAWEQELLAYGTEVLGAIKGLQLIGTALQKTSILSFTLDDVHPHDIGSLLDADGVAVRAGHHCTQPLMARFKVPATARASLSFYNRKADVDALAAAIIKTQLLFA